MRFEPQFISHITYDYNRSSEIHLKEIDHQIIYCHRIISFRCKSYPELRREDERVENETKPRSYDARLGSKWQLRKSVIIEFPGRSESNVTQTNSQPRKYRAQSTQCQQPIEYIILRYLIKHSGISDESHRRRNNNGDQRTTLTIDIGENLWSLVLFCQSGEGARRTIDRGVADGEDGDHYHNVED